MWLLLSWAGADTCCQHSTGLRQLVMVALQVLLLQVLWRLLLLLRPPCLSAGPVAAPALHAPAAVVMAARCCLRCSCVS